MLYLVNPTGGTTVECSCSNLEYNAVFSLFFHTLIVLGFLFLNSKLDVPMWCIASVGVCPLYYLCKITLFYDSNSAETV